MTRTTITNIKGTRMKLNHMRKIITAGITGSTVAAAAFTSMASLAIEYKHVAVAPENMESQKLQAVQDKGLFSHSTMLPILASKLKGQTFEQKIYLDGPMDSPIVLISPDADQWLMSD